MIKRLAFIVAMLFIPALAKADSVWTYQGNVNGIISGNEGYALSGTVLLNNNDQAVAWNFTTGTPGIPSSSPISTLQARLIRLLLGVRYLSPFGI